MDQLSKLVNELAEYQLRMRDFTPETCITTTGVARIRVSVDGAIVAEGASDDGSVDQAANRCRAALIEWEANRRQS